MKKVLLLLMAMFVTLGAYALEVTYNAPKPSKSVQPYNSWAPDENFEFTFAKSSGTVEPSNNKDGYIRLYAKNTMNIESKNGEKITSIVFNLSATSQVSAITSNIGAVAAQTKGGKNVTWSGETTSITFTLSQENTYGTGTSKAGQLSFSSVTITYEPAGDPKEEVTLTWSKSVDNINLGDEYTAPTLTVNPEVARSSVQYKSSNESLVVVENGTIILKEGVAGTATITASIPATNKQYKATPAEYTIKVIDPNAPTGYKLVTDVANLKNGTKIIIVDSSKNRAMSTTQNENNRGVAPVDINNTENSIEPGEDVQIIELQKNGNNYALYVTGTKSGEEVVSGYLASASSSKNYLKTQDAIVLASITIDSNHNATIKFTGEYTKNIIKSNSTSNLFSCYGTGQNDVQIYALPNTYKVEAPMNVTPVDYVVNGKVLGSANKLTLTPTIYVNGNPESDLTGYEIYLDDTKIGDAIDGEISGFAYTGADQKFTLHDGDNIIPFEVNGLTFETAPQIEGVQYLDETDVDGNTSHHVAFYVVPTATSQDLNWVVTAPEGVENGPDIFWRTHDTFKGAACHFYNINEDGTGVPESFEVRISYPIAIPNTPAQGARLMANETNEYTYELYHAAPATLSTTEYAKNEANTSTSGMADVAVDQDSEVEFFNLQGVRVEGELTPGLYIRRQGNQATKVIVK